MTKGPTWRDLSAEELFVLWSDYGKLPAPQPCSPGDNRDRPECGSGMGYALTGDWIQCVFTQGHPATRRKGRGPNLFVGQFYQIRTIAHEVHLNAAGQVRWVHEELWIYREDGHYNRYTPRNFRFVPPPGRAPREPSKVYPNVPPPPQYVIAPPVQIKVGPRIIWVEESSRKIQLD